MEKAKFNKLVGNQIRELRIQKKLTQAELANKIGKDYQSVQRIELGKMNPTIFYLYEIAQALEISLSELLDFKVPSN